MDVGQIMMQMSTGIASTGSTPATADLATAESAGQSGSSFAGMLLGKSADSPEAATKGMAAAPGSGVEAPVLKQADVNTEMMAALMAVVDPRVQMPVEMVTGVEDNQEKPEVSEQQGALMSQDVALLATGPQILLPVEGNGRMPQSGLTVEPRNKPEKSAESAQQDAQMLQDMMLFASGTQIVLSLEGNDRKSESGLPVESQGKADAPMSQNVAQLAAGAQNALLAGVNGRMPESGQSVELQNDDKNQLRRPVSNVREVAMSATAGNELSRPTTAAQQKQSAELLMSNMTTPTADSITDGESKTGKMDAAALPEVVVTDGDMDTLENGKTLNSLTASVKGGAVAITAEKTPDVQRSVGAKESAVQSVSSQEVSAVKADVNIQPIAENSPEKMAAPADARVIQASATVFPHPAPSLKETGANNSGHQEDGKLGQLDAATSKKNMEGVSTDAAKVVPASVPEMELLKEGGKDSSDHGTNGQFHQSVSQQQVKADTGSSLGSTSGAGQKESPINDMSENVFRQVKEVLVNREVKAGNEQITMKLSPEHLGELTLNFKMENQQLRVEIVAANRGVRDSLMQQADNLKESLARQNITMESFDVVTSNGQRGFEQNDRGWKQLAQQNFMAGSSAGGYRYRVPEADISAVPQYGMQKQYTMVDVHY